MSRWRAENITLEIGPESISLEGGAAPQRLAAPAGNWQAMGAELTQLAHLAPPRARLSVRVANCWARFFLFDPPLGVSGLRECRLLLDARFEALYGAGANWLVQADWHAGRAMLACAIPRALHQALAPLAPARLAPALLDDWNAHCASLPATALWCAAGDGVVTLLYWEDGAMRLVRQQRGADAGALMAQQFALLGTAPPAVRYWSGSRAPDGWRLLEGRA